MAGVGLVSTALMTFLQKKLFLSVDAFRIYITGAPAYAHLTRAAIDTLPPVSAVFRINSALALVAWM